MYWRLQAKGYPASRAWLEETAWCYRMGLLGYAAFALSALTLSSQPFEANTRLFHLLTWIFFVVAHLPDFLAASAVRSSRTVLNLLPALVIAAVNTAAAWQDERIAGQLALWFPQAHPLLLTAANQAGLILGAFLIHGLVNATTLALSRLATRNPRIATTITTTAPPTPKTIAAEPESPSAPVKSRSPALPPVQNNPPLVPLPELPVNADSATGTTPQTTGITAPGRSPKQIPPAPFLQTGPLPLPPNPTTIPYTNLPLPTFSLWDKLMGRHRQPPTPPAQPHQDIIQLLLNTPQKQLRPTIRFISTVSIGGNLGSATPLLLENPEDDLFFPDGTIDGRVLAQFISRMSAIRSFVPKTRIGRRTYRPIARRMSKRLYRSWQTWLRTLACPASPEVQKAGEHILRLPPDEAPLLLCIGASPFHLERATSRILLHLLQKNALTHLVDVRVATLSPTPGPGPIPNPEQEQFLHHENQILSRLDIHPVHHGQCGIPSLSRSLLQQASAIITVDEHSQNTLWLRLKASEPALKPQNHPPILSLQTVFPHRFRPIAAGRKQRPSTLKKILPAIEASITATLLPYLLARASQNPSASPHTPEITRSYSNNASSPEEIDAFRAALRTVCTPAHLSRKRIPVKNVLKLITALASGDPAILLMHGIPESLLAHSRDVGSLENATLGRCLSNLPKARSFIPSERRKDYDPALRLLKQSAD
ncbi:MAG: hypothetical protein RI897_1663 [Verrucomicrobiota bacterium]|jgi:hypothetical protein